MSAKQIIDAMWDDSPVDVSTEVNFIWSIANKLRGPYRSDKYKDVIIPMTIIRRFECALAPTKQKVVEQFKANPNFPAKAGSLRIRQPQQIFLAMNILQDSHSIINPSFCFSFSAATAYSLRRLPEFFPPDTQYPCRNGWPRSYPPPCRPPSDPQPRRT